MRSTGLRGRRAEAKIAVGGLSSSLRLGRPSPILALGQGLSEEAVRRSTVAGAVTTAGKSPIRHGSPHPGRYATGGRQSPVPLIKRLAVCSPSIVGGETASGRRHTADVSSNTAFSRRTAESPARKREGGRCERREAHLTRCGLAGGI